MQRNKQSTGLQQHPRTQKYLGVVLRNKRGFTLIELLTVISVISFIATAGIAALNTARAKARDATILADVDALTKALELYYDDNGHYSPMKRFVDGHCYVSMLGDGTAEPFRSAMMPYIPHLPDHGMFVNPYKAGVAPATGRIMYTNVEVGLLGNNCFMSVENSPGGDQYAIAFYLETATDLGPPDVYVRLTDGSIQPGSCNGLGGVNICW